jgi:hypothetical protein
MKGTVDGETKRSESGVTWNGTHVSNDDKQRALARLLIQSLLFELHKVLLAVSTCETLETLSVDRALNRWRGAISLSVGMGCQASVRTWRVHDDFGVLVFLALSVEQSRLAHPDCSLSLQRIERGDAHEELHVPKGGEGIAKNRARA